MIMLFLLNAAGTLEKLTDLQTNVLKAEQTLKTKQQLRDGELDRLIQAHLHDKNPIQVIQPSDTVGPGTYTQGTIVFDLTNLGTTSTYLSFYIKLFLDSNDSVNKFVSISHGNDWQNIHSLLAAGKEQYQEVLSRIALLITQHKTPEQLAQAKLQLERDARAAAEKKIDEARHAIGATKTAALNPNFPLAVMRLPATYQPVMGRGGAKHPLEIVTGVYSGTKKPVFVQLGFQEGLELNELDKLPTMDLGRMMIAPKDASGMAAGRFHLTRPAIIGIVNLYKRLIGSEGPIILGPNDQQALSDLIIAKAAIEKIRVKGFEQATCSAEFVESQAGFGSVSSGFRYLVENKSVGVPLTATTPLIFTAEPKTTGEEPYVLHADVVEAMWQKFMEAIAAQNPAS